MGKIDTRTEIQKMIQPTEDEILGTVKDIFLKIRHVNSVKNMRFLRIAFDYKVQVLLAIDKIGEFYCVIPYFNAYGDRDELKLITDYSSDMISRFYNQ